MPNAKLEKPVLNAQRLSHKSHIQHQTSFLNYCPEQQMFVGRTAAQPITSASQGGRRATPVTGKFGLLVAMKL